jgi:hypothetical protein
MQLKQTPNAPIATKPIRENTIRNILDNTAILPQRNTMKQSFCGSRGNFLNNGSVGLSAKFSSSRDLAKKIMELDNDKI